MSVSVSTTVGVGFKVPTNEALDFFESKYLADELEQYLEDFPLLTFIQAGDDSEYEYVVAVKRLTSRLPDPMYSEGNGVFGLDKPVIALDERIQLLDVAANLMGREPVVGQFIAIRVS